MIKLSGKGKSAKILYLSVLVFCFMLNPALLWADTSANKTEYPSGIRLSTSIELHASAVVGSQNDITLVPDVSKNKETLIALDEKNPLKGNEGAITAPKSEADGESVPEEDQAESPHIADPIAPVNKVMFQFNDKLYFWAVKPVTQVYSHIVPEDFRFAFSNVYDNLWAPSRVLNNLFQLRFKAAGNELIRFVFNTFAGVGGMGDMAKEALGIKKQDADFGQTLGHYGVGHGIYLVLPVFGPSSIRDGVGLIADQFMHPLTYVPSSYLTFGETVGIFVHSKINDTSFKIGDYESFKEASLDPYISMRDAYVQYRQKKVEESKK